MGHVFQREAAWYAGHRVTLLDRYRGEHVAIIDEAVIDHDREFAALASRVFVSRPALFPERTILQRMMS